MAAIHNVGDLFLMFKDCYNLFEERFDGSTLGDAIICFGITGAGKSAFLARLLSSLPPKSFVAKLNSDDDKVIIEGVEIGHLAPSTTLVPVRYTVGALGVYDVPGFKDNDPQKQIVINILHKCLLNRVKSAKFLVILRVEVLFDQKMTILIDDYHNKLKELFGEDNYPSFIKNIHFIITHNDKAGIDARDIKIQITEKMVETVDLSNSHLPQFFKRLLKHHTVVDYATHTGEELLGELTGILKAQADEGNMGVRIPEIQKSGLDLHANQLNAICVDTMDLKIEGFREMEDQHRANFARSEEKVVAARGAIFEVLKTVTTQKDIIGQMKEDNKRRVAAIETNVTVRAETEIAISEEQLLITNFEQQQQFMHDELGKIWSVSLRTDLSRNTGTAMKWHTFRSVVGMEEEEFQHSTILVVTAEPKDRTLRGYIDNGGSLLPKRIKRIDDCKLSIVMYNSKMRIHNRKELPTADTAYDVSSGLLAVHFAGPLPFKVLIYTAVEFVTTPAAQLLSAHYRESLDAAQAKLRELETTLEQANMSSANSEKAIHQNDVQMQQEAELLAHNENDLGGKTKSFNKMVESALASLDSAKAATKRSRIGQDKEATLIKEIGEIFDQNELVTKLTGKIQKHESMVSTILKELGGFSVKLDQLAQPKELEARPLSTSPSRKK